MRPFNDPEQLSPAHSVHHISSQGGLLLDIHLGLNQLRCRQPMAPDSLVFSDRQEPVILIPRSVKSATRPVILSDPGYPVASRFRVKHDWKS